MKNKLISVKPTWLLKQNKKKVLFILIGNMFRYGHQGWWDTAGGQQSSGLHYEPCQPLSCWLNITIPAVLSVKYQSCPEAWRETGFFSICISMLLFIFCHLCLILWSSLIPIAVTVAVFWLIHYLWLGLCLHRQNLEISLWLLLGGLCTGSWCS